MGETSEQALRVDFDSSVKLEFHGVSRSAGLSGARRSLPSHGLRGRGPLRRAERSKHPTQLDGSPEAGGIQPSRRIRGHQ